MRNFKDIVLYEHKYIWHTIKPGTAEHGTTEHPGTVAEHTTEYWQNNWNTTE